MTTNVTWPGSNGRAFVYSAYTIRHSLHLLPRVAGNYIFAKRSGLGHWVAIYVGIADNLYDRVLGHERWQEACNLGMDTVMVRIQPLEHFRRAEERDLIAHINPPLNRQHRSNLFG